MPTQIRRIRLRPQLGADERSESPLKQCAVGHLLAEQRHGQQGQQNAPTDFALERQARLNMRQEFGEVSLCPQHRQRLDEETCQREQKPIGAQVSPKSPNREAEIVPRPFAEAAFDQQVDDGNQRKERLGGGDESHPKQGHSDDEDGLEQNAIGFHI